MSELSRRALLRNISAALVAAGGIGAEAAQQVHGMTAAEKAATGAYKPKAFTAHEYATLRLLGDLILPADEKSPAASEAGCVDWIDLLASSNPELAAIYTGGILWLDARMLDQYGTRFREATAEHQTAMLDRIGYRKNSSPELAPGVHFFEWARKMVVDAFYTSPVGVKDLGYVGNTAVSKFEIPQEALAYALKRSPV